MCSFTFFIKECKRTLHSFWFHESYKKCKSGKKECKRTQRSFFKVKKERNVFFSIYIYIYLYISIYIYIYIYKYTNIVPFFYKERKRTQISFRSFIKNIKERKDCSVLLKRTEKNAKLVPFFYKELKRTQR